MKKTIIASIILILVILVGVFAIFHKSSKSTSSSGSSTNSQSNAPAINNSVLITKTDAKVGQYLADPSGKPLYTYNADSNGVSNCTGSCLTNWPPYEAKGSTDNLPAGVGTITRSDNGQKQYTFNGMPLYYFTSDTAGNVTGNGVENFSIAKPATPSSSSSSSTTPTQPNTSSGSSGYSY